MRLPEFDLMRGIALITIMLNHYTLFSVDLGYRALKFPTLTSFGYSSSAELFFILSGYLIGLLYLGKERPVLLHRIAAKFLGRSVYLLAMNCFLFVSILAISMHFTDELKETLGLKAVSDDPHFASYHVVRIGYHIPLLGILGFYVLMMLAAIPFSVILTRSTRASLITIASLYILSQMFPNASLSGGRFGEEALMAFNPLAWQVLFLGGMVAGRHSLHEYLISLAKSNRPYFTIMATLTIITAFYIFNKINGDFPLLYSDKQNLEAFRLFHAVLIFAALFMTASRLSFMSKTFIWKAISTIGRHSLQCFMFGVVVSYTMASVLSYQVDTTRYFAISIAGIFSLYTFALFVNYYKSLQRTPKNPSSKIMKS